MEEVERFAIGVTPTPSIDVTFHDGSYLALRAAFVDHAHWLREASQRWREDVVDARERRREPSEGDAGAADGSRTTE